jgi:hypothetical protein
MTAIQDYFRQLAPLPMPYLLLQLGVGLAWVGFVAWSVRRWGRRGFWALATAPVAVLGWYLSYIAALFLACAVGAGCV